MKTTGLKEYSRYSLLFFFVILGFVSFLIIKPLISVFLGAMILAYIFYPVYKFVNGKIKNDGVSSFIVSLLVIIIIMGPLLFVANILFQESVNFFHSINNIASSGFVSKISQYFGGGIDLENYFKTSLNDLTVFIIQGISSFIFTIPSKIVSLVIMLISMFYFFKNGEDFVKMAKKLIPLNSHYSDVLFNKSKDVMSSMIYGTLIVSVIQAVLALIGFLVFGYSSPFLFSIAVFILALLPFVGASIVWAPLALVKLYQGDSFAGLGLIIYALLTITVVELWFKPKIIGRRANVHPILILFGAIGGFNFLGIIGVVIGPIVLDLFFSFLRLAEVEKREANN